MVICFAFMFSKNAFSETSTVFCTSLSGITVSTWIILPAGDLNIPIPNPYDLTGKQCLQADFNGDGILDLLVQGANAGDETVIFHGQATNLYREVSQVIPDGTNGVNWSFEDVAISAEDKNGDGKSELFLESQGASSKNAVFYADSTGTFNSPAQTWDYVSEAIDGTESSAVGQTAGNFTVTPTGTFNYSIPIKMPPGRNGMQPSLSLSYSSQGGNGLLGVGWTIGGVSSITRCPKTEVTDAEKGTITFTNNDRFCLNGQKLILHSGTYGAANSTYRTEIDSFLYVTAFGTAGTGPAGFRVEAKGGGITYFGANGDSSQTDGQKIPEGVSTPLSWSIKRVQDVNGNAIEYKYHTINGHRLDEITYTHFGSSEGDRRVKFSYVIGRDDTNPVYVGGGKLTLNAKLSNVRTYVNSSLVSKYLLSYANVSAKQRVILDSVTECGPTSCKEPLDFFWLSGSDGTFNTKVGANTLYQRTIGTGRVKYGDFNGDGRTDIYYVRTAQKDQVFLANDDGSFGSAKDGLNVYIGSDLNYANVDISRFKFGDFNGDGMTDIYRVTGWDDNDVLSYDQFYLSKGDGTFHSGVNGLHTHVGNTPPEANRDIARYKLGDFDGDGKTDIYYIPASQGMSADDIVYLTRTATSSSFTYETAPGLSTYVGTEYSYAQFDMNRIKLGDFNGDGLTDIYKVSGWEGANLTDHVHLSSPGGGFSTAGIPALNSQIRSTIEKAQIDVSRFILADFNSDGKTDIYYVKSNGGNPTDNSEVDDVYLSKGDGTFAVPVKGLNTFVNAGLGGAIVDFARIKLGDINGDGKLDIYYMEGGWERPNLDKIHFGNGDGTFQDSIDGLSTGVNDGSYSLATIDISRIQLADFNGDGISDIYQVNGWLSEANDTVHLSDSKRKLISAFQDDGEFRIDVDYSFMTDNSIYSKSTLAPGSGIRNVQNSKVLVENVRETINGISQLNRNFQYHGAKVATNGRGFLGFEEITETYVERDIVITTKFRQDFPFIGKPESMVKTNSGKKLKEVSTNWESIISNSGRYFPSARVVTKKNYDPNVVGKVLLNETVTTTEVDWYGNVESITEIIKDKGGNTKRTITTTIPNYVNYRHGRAERRIIQSDINDASPVTRTISYTYDSVGRLKSETQEPLSSSELKFAYGYDQYGNQISVTTSGSDILTRTASTAFGGDGYFPSSASNALGHIEYQAYDPRFGQQVQITGPNGLTTEWEFDEFGRLIEEKLADGVTTTTQRTSCITESGMHSDCMSLESYFIQTTTTGNAPVLVFYDSLGRETRSRTTGFDPAGGTSNYIFTHTAYDEFGRVKGKTNPYYDNGGQVFWNCMAYDSLNRITREYYPGSSGSCNNLSLHKEKLRIIYSGWVDGKGIKTTQMVTKIKSDQTKEYQYTSEFLDVLGNKVRVEDAESGYIRYIYNASGELTRVKTGEIVGSTDVEKANTWIGYDDLGYKNYMNDPDKGQWYYKNNVLGQLVEQTDAKGQKTINEYDLLGRLVKRTEPGEDTTDGQNQITHWYYDTASSGIGKLHRVSTPITDFEREYEYDGYGRPTKIHHTVNSNLFTESMTYSSGRIATHTYPVTGLTVRNHYDANGFFYKTTNNSTGERYWQLNSMNAFGQIENQTLGNSISVTGYYDRGTGRVSNQRVNGGGAFYTYYTFDSLGNLERRQDYRAAYTETYTYDKLNRVDSSTRTASGYSSSYTNSINYDYDALGNIKVKSDFGNDYRYDNGRPHAVSRVYNSGSLVANYGYDSNGNMVTGDGRAFSYTSFNKVRSITKGSNQSVFYYDSERMRTYAKNGNKTTYYINPRADIGLHFEKETLVTTSGVDVEYKHFIYGAEGVVGVVKHIENGTSTVQEDVNYLIKDHLGSTVMVLDSSGGCLARYIYEAFGEQRQVACSSTGTADSLINIYHGYTGHEQLDQYGIIHMNGRLFDPKLGRMLQADSYIQAPGNTQSYNRYSYVMNNPVAFVDPDGYWRISVSLHWGVGGHFSYDHDTGHASVGVGVGVGEFAGAGGSFSVGHDDWDVGFNADNYVDVGYHNGYDSFYVQGSVAGHYGGANGTYYLNTGELVVGAGTGYGMVGVNGGYSTFSDDFSAGASLGGKHGGVGASYDFGSQSWSYSVNVNPEAFGQKSMSEMTLEELTGYTTAQLDLHVEAGQQVAVLPVIVGLGVRKFVVDFIVKGIGKKSLLGKNPKIKKDRTLTDLDPTHDRSTAKSIFRNQTKGQNVRQFTNGKGDIIRRADDGTQIRMNPNGSTRLDLPRRGTQPNGETVHFNP